MPHYADGTPAAPGDLVSGRTIESDRPLVGEVICVEDCSIHVARPIVQPIGLNQDLPHQGLYFGPLNEPYGVTAEVAKGLAACFSLLHRGPQPDAEVLPKDSDPPASEEKTEKSEEDQSPPPDDRPKENPKRGPKRKSS